MKSGAIDVREDVDADDARRCRAPSERAASTNWFCLVVSTSARVTRA